MSAPTPSWYPLRTLRAMNDPTFRSVLEAEIYRGAAVERPIPKTPRHIEAALDVATYANARANHHSYVQIAQVRHVHNRVFFSILPKSKRGSGERPVIVPQERLFTPRDPVTHFRFVMQLSAEERRTLPSRGLGLRGTVTDEITGRRYKVYGASCGLSNCQCDAIVRQV